MNDIVIKAEKLGKKYVIGHQAEKGGYKALRDVLIQNARTLWSKTKDLATGKPIIQGGTMEEVWALKDLSFEICRGEAVGIIGRNGAGKSTLLKILSRITEPTTGRVTIKGRVASLLEVGTGFHPELSGRENIYLNGAILGMTRVEITQKFDEIVAFAEVEKFLDTPVKRYSSGMYVRLAFAVAAHLEPEILVVDEVLAVGDAQFQQKCLGKMQDVGKEGRTVLFVSHNMSSIKKLCTRGILLFKGNITEEGMIDDVVGHYLGADKRTHLLYESLTDKSAPHIRHAEIYQKGQDGTSFKMHHPIIIDFDLETRGRKNVAVAVVIQNNEGVWVNHSSDEFSDSFSETASSLRRCTIPPYALAKGKYVVDIFTYIRNVEVFESIIRGLTFDIEYSGVMSDRITGDWKGLCGPGLLKWEHLYKR